jgi:hypothetical protein
MSRDVARGDRGVPGGIVPAIDKEQREDISYPEDGSSLESSGSTHQTAGCYFSEDITTHYARSNANREGNRLRSAKINQPGYMMSQNYSIKGCVPVGLNPHVPLGSSTTEKFSRNSVNIPSASFGFQHGVQATRDGHVSVEKQSLWLRG